MKTPLLTDFFRVLESSRIALVACGEHLPNESDADLLASRALQDIADIQKLKNN